MRLLVFASVLFLGSLAYSKPAVSCTQLEAQFIGVVTEVRTEEIDQGQDAYNCYFKMEFQHYRVSSVCPLYFREVEKTEVLDSACSRDLKAGQILSGVLALKNGQLFID